MSESTCFTTLTNALLRFERCLPTTPLTQIPEEENLLFMSRNSRKSEQAAETTAAFLVLFKRWFAARIGPLQVQGPFFGYFLLGLEKKVTRLPAGTGEVEVSIIEGFLR